jgi:hypothetical protein
MNSQRWSVQSLRLRQRVRNFWNSPSHPAQLSYDRVYPNTYGHSETVQIILTVYPC